MRSHRLLAAAVAALTLALAACSTTAKPTGPTPISDATRKALQLDGDWSWTPQAGKLDLGVTHTQDSLDPGEPADARQRGVDILKDSAGWQNHHLMGFGTLNPEPSPGEYDWSSLDRRMKLTQDTGGKTVLTVCCAPDWMKGGKAGDTDWSRLEEAPNKENFGDYAKLAAAAVQRYPQIQRVLVWNELKGFYRQDDNRWDYESYTDLYNKVYKAVKEVRPSVQVGGPYAVITSLDPGSSDSSDLRGPWGVADRRALDIVEYWLANNAGADFVTVDGSTGTRNNTVATPADVAAQKYADVTTWIRARTKLPVWWAEFYPDVPSGSKGAADSPASAASTLAAVAAYARSGASGALLWGPQGSSLRYSALWTDSTKDGGGKPTQLTQAWQWLAPRLAKGQVEIGRSPTLPLLAFRSDDGILLVNMTAKPVEVKQGVDPIPAWAVTLTTRDS